MCIRDRIGTVIKEAESGQVITEINDDKQEFILLKGTGILLFLVIIPMIKDRCV